MAAVVALKLAEVAVTVTEAGTVRVELTEAEPPRVGLVSDRATITPPVGAGLVRVTVQVVEAFGPTLEGLQASEETSTDAARLTLVLAELPLYEAVMVAL